MMRPPVESSLLYLLAPSGTVYRRKGAEWHSWLEGAWVPLPLGMGLAADELDHLTVLTEEEAKALTAGATQRR